MLTVLLILAVTALALLVLAAWWVRRANLAVALAGRPRLEHLPPDCPLTIQLNMAATDAGGGTTGGGAAGGGAAPAPRRRKPSGPSRRAFLRTSWLLGWLGVLSGFSGASLAFLWPNLRGGFGARLPVATEEEILAEIDANQGSWAYRPGRTLFVRYDPSLDPDGAYADLTNGLQVLALYQRCVHLGCTVPWCAESQWWECPCHGSKYNRWGEWQDGPAPRGLDRFVVQPEEGMIVLDTSRIITGPSRDGGVLAQPPEGPHCVDI